MVYAEDLKSLPRKWLRVRISSPVKNKLVMLDTKQKFKEN